MASMAVPKLIFLTICFLIRSISALQNITLNSPLFANDKSSSSSLVSPSGDFAFGFQKLNNTNLFLLAIWFDNIPDKTIIWYANGDKPAQEGSKLELDATGLVLTDPDGQQKRVININQIESVSYGAMLDTGNFVLVGSNSSFLWESFKNPTDTILPSQKLEFDTVLFSRLTETNFSKGRFELYFSNGNLELSPIAWPTKLRYKSYFITETSANEAGSAPQLVFNETSDIYIASTNGEITQISWKGLNTGLIPAGNYYRATLDYNGVFTQYAYPKNSNDEQSWRIVKYIPENICIAIFNDYGSGSCGYNSYCSMVNGRPNCACPSGYSLMDGNNSFGGCKPNFPVDCGVNDTSENLEELYEMQKLQNVNWPLGDYERLEPYSEAECTNSCLQDCLCDVAIYGGTICWKKRIPLANGRVESGNAVALIKVRKGAPLDYPASIYINKKPDKSILIASLSTSVVLNGLLLIIVPLVLFLKFNKNSNRVNQVSTFFETNLHMFSYKELQEATDNFKEQIGRGSSAIVYKGILRFGSNNVIAIKKLDKLIQEADKEFKTELKTIGKTCHKNLVRLLGFCEEGAHRLLVYEFMTNGTLANFLLGIPKPGWNTRAKIALEIARGLVYLHEECEVPIIHCDIKPENILLDESFSARISDFGLAKLLASNQSRTLTNIRGTKGYVAPEWFRNVAVTAKVDVYSFGVMLLEIICCRKNILKLEEEEGILTDWVCDCFMAGKVDAFVESVTEAVGDKDRVHRWLSIAIWCIQEDPSKRPPMKMILQMLEGCIEVPPPPPCFFSTSF